MARGTAILWPLTMIRGVASTGLDPFDSGRRNWSCAGEPRAAPPVESRDIGGAGERRYRLKSLKSGSEWVAREENILRTEN